jgi:hypothetical protein
VFSPLWRREFRGAQRRWWRQPWVPPVVLAGAVLAVTLDGDPAWIAPLKFGPITVDGVEGLLVIWVLWVVTHAIARDRSLEGNVALAVTPIPRAEIVIAKTLAPSIVPLLAMAALRSPPFLEGEADGLAALGFQIRAFDESLATVAVTLAAAIHLVLVPLFLPTLASRVATRIRLPSFAFGISLLFAVGVLLAERWFALADIALLPLCGAALTVWTLVLLDSNAIAFLATLGLGVCLYDLVTEDPTLVRTVLCFAWVPLTLLIIAIRGHDRISGLIALGTLGFLVALELQWKCDADGRVRAQAAVPFLFALLLIWLFRWRRWTRRRFWSLYFRAE